MEPIAGIEPELLSYQENVLYQKHYIGARIGAADGNRTRDSCMASKCVSSSTTAAITKSWMGRVDSNHRPSVPETDVLSLNYFPIETLFSILA